MKVTPRGGPAFSSLWVTCSATDHRRNGVSTWNQGPVRARFSDRAKIYTDVPRGGFVESGADPEDNSSAGSNVTDGRDALFPNHHDRDFREGTSPVPRSFLAVDEPLLPVNGLDALDVFGVELEVHTP